MPFASNWPGSNVIPLSGRVVTASVAGSSPFGPSRMTSSHALNESVTYTAVSVTTRSLRKPAGANVYARSSSPVVAS